MFAFILPEGIKIDAYMYMHGALVYKSYVQGDHSPSWGGGDNAQAFYI